MPEQVHTARQAAIIFGVTLETIHDWIRQGKLEAHRVGEKGHWRIPESAVQKLVDQRYP